MTRTSVYIKYAGNYKVSREWSAHRDLPRWWAKSEKFTLLLNDKLSQLPRYRVVDQRLNRIVVGVPSG